MTKKRILPPRRTRMQRSERLQAARKWLAGYGGKSVVTGYARWFHVDRRCAIKELRMLGVDVPPREDVIAQEMVQQASARRALATQKKLEEARTLLEFELQFDECWAALHPQ